MPGILCFTTVLNKLSKKFNFVPQKEHLTHRECRMDNGELTPVWYSWHYFFSSQTILSPVYSFNVPHCMWYLLCCRMSLKTCPNKKVENEFEWLKIEKILSPFMIKNLIWTEQLFISVMVISCLQFAFYKSVNQQK